MSHQTKTGSLLGTPHYMAPEQAENVQEGRPPRRRLLARLHPVPDVDRARAVSRRRVRRSARAPRARAAAAAVAAQPGGAAGAREDRAARARQEARFPLRVDGRLSRGAARSRALLADARWTRRRAAHARRRRCRGRRRRDGPAAGCAAVAVGTFSAAVAARGVERRADDAGAAGARGAGGHEARAAQRREATTNRRRGGPIRSASCRPRPAKATVAEPLRASAP